MTRRVCFITNELHPIAPGGIGRLMHNFARANQAKNHGAELHYLFPETDAEQQPRIKAALHGLGQVHFCAEGDPPADLFEQGLELAEVEQPFTQPYLHSVRYMRALARLRRQTGFDFDVIEFPDYGGWAFATLAAKASGLDFGLSCIAVRLHSSFGLISRAERFYHQASAGLGVLCDMERYCLEKADLVVGHLAVIADLNAAHYGLGAAWRARVRIEFPPILPDEEPPGAWPASLAYAEDAPVFVFSSRLQPFKRPDCFIRAGARFLRRNPDSKARFLLVSYGFDEAYIEHLSEMIPAAHRAQIMLLQGLTAAERRAILARGIAVIPSDYESLCLFAYESALLGRCVILNRDCAAFSGCERWVDGENCLMFEADYPGLAEAMEAALRFTPRSIVNVEPDTPYWLGELPGRATADAALPRARVLVLFEGDAAAFPELCFRLSRMMLDHAAVTIALPEAPWHKASRATALARHFGWDLLFHDAEAAHPAELNRWIAGMDEEILILLRQDDSLEPGYLGTGLRAMRENPALVMFGTHVARLEQGRILGLELFAGALPSLALTQAVICPAACMIRRSALLARPLDPLARGQWLEIFSRETVLNGGEVLIAPAALVTCARRAAGRSNRLIDGTLRDELGLADGLRPRLLALDAAGASAGWRDNPVQTLAGRALGGISRVWPPALDVDWEPVRFQDDYQNVLVHPLPGTIVLGHLFVNLARKPQRLECAMRNAHAGNMGFEVIAALRPEPLPADALANLAEDGPLGAEWTGWVFMPPDTRCTLTLPAGRQQGSACHLYVGTRLQPGANNFFAWAHLETVMIY